MIRNVWKLLKKHLPTDVIFYTLAAGFYFVGDVNDATFFLILIIVHWGFKIKWEITK